MPAGPWYNDTGFKGGMNSHWSCKIPSLLGVRKQITKLDLEINKIIPEEEDVLNFINHNVNKCRIGYEDYIGGKLNDEREEVARNYLQWLIYREFKEFEDYIDYLMNNTEISQPTIFSMLFIRFPLPSMMSRKRKENVNKPEPSGWHFDDYNIKTQTIWTPLGNVNPKCNGGIYFKHDDIENSYNKTNEEDWIVTDVIRGQALTFTNDIEHAGTIIDWKMPRVSIDVRLSNSSEGNKYNQMAKNCKFYINERKIFRPNEFMERAKDVKNICEMAIKYYKEYLE